MKTYEVVFDENSDRGVYALSCVDNPAMEDVWVRLSKDEKELKKELPEEMKLSAVDEERRILLGAALIPDKPIYRNIQGEEFWITFSKDTIEKAAHAFLRNGFQNNSSENHQIKLEGVSVVESWLVDNPETDKSKMYGKTYEKGTWVTMMKVHNEEAWEKAKNGELNGFSIDGQFSLKQVQLKKENMSEEVKSFADKVFELLGAKKSEVKMGRLKLKDGKGIVEFEGDAPEVGMPVFGLSEDKEERFPLPEGEHELEDGNKLHVDKNGLVSEQPKKEPENVEEVKEVVAEMAKHFTEKLEAIELKMSEAKKESDAEIAKKDEKIKELEAKLEKEPAERKIVKTELAIKEPKTAKERLFNAVHSAQHN